MANRRANKKLRALARARMAATGEGYQRSLTALRAEQSARSGEGSVDLIECTYYGVPLTLATFDDPRLPRIVVMPRIGREATRLQPLSWMRFLQARGVQ